MKLNIALGKDHPNNENYDSFGRIVERISTKGLFDALDEFESILKLYKVIILVGEIMK